jgi:hypothetical protein
MLTGHRKFTLGAMYLMMSWAAFVWAPGIDPVTRTSILQSQVVVFGLVIGGNVVENLKKQPTTGG